MADATKDLRAGASAVSVAAAPASAAPAPAVSVAAALASAPASAAPASIAPLSTAVVQSTRPRDFLARHGLGLVGALLFLLLWEFAARAFWRDPQVLPSPTQAMASAWRHLSALELAAHVGVSMARIIVGFAIAAVLGIALGVAAGWYRWVGRIVRPVVDLLRPVPPLAWIPIAIVWFGLGEKSKWFVIFLGAFFPIFTNAYRGMIVIPPVLLRAARTMDVDGIALLAKVALPAALPDIATGLRVGFGLSFGILVAAELIAADRGMGFLVMQSRQIGELGVAVFGILLIGVVSLVSDAAIAAALRRVVGRGVRR